MKFCEFAHIFAFQCFSWRFALMEGPAPYPSDIVLSVGRSILEKTRSIPRCYQNTSLRYRGAQWPNQIRHTWPINSGVFWDGLMRPTEVNAEAMLGNETSAVRHLVRRKCIVLTNCFTSDMFIRQKQLGQLFTICS